MTGTVSGHVFRYEGKRRPVWRAKYRLPDGRQVQKTLGPAWTSRGRSPAGYFTKRTAESWLRVTLAKAAEGTLPGMVHTGATVADACAEYLRYIEQDRARKPSTLRDYDSIFRNHVLPHLDDAKGALSAGVLRSGLLFGCWPWVDVRHDHAATVLGGGTWCLASVSPRLARLKATERCGRR